MWLLGAPLGWRRRRTFGEKRIVIGRDCGFFVVADSVLSPGNVLVYWARFSDRCWLNFKTLVRAFKVRLAS